MNHVIMAVCTQWYDWEIELRNHPTHHTETDYHFLNDIMSSPAEERVLVKGSSCAKCIGKDGYNNHICFEKMEL